MTAGPISLQMLRLTLQNIQTLILMILIWEYDLDAVDKSEEEDEAGPAI